MTLSRPARLPTGAARIVIWFVATWLLVFPHLSRLGTHVVGDRGDGFFNYYVLRWDAHVLTHPSLWGDYWAGTIFHGAHLPMAYSDTHLGIAPIFTLLQAITGNGVMAMNVMYIASWMIGCEAVYRLALRIITRPGAALVAAIGWTFATIRIAQFGHFQLAIGALVPVVILLTLDLLERPRWWRGVVLAVVWAMCTLSASYYGILLALTMLIMVMAHLGPPLLHRRWRETTSTLVALGAAAVTAAVLTGPVLIRYLDLQSDPAFRRGYEPDYAARWADLRATRAAWVGHWFGLDDAPRSSEQLAFVGFVIGLFALVGVVAIIRRQSTLTPRGRWTLVTLGAVGALVLLIGLGRNVSLFGAHLPAPYDLFVHLPGFKGMRAISRLLVLPQLVLALLAAVGIDAMLAHHKIADRRVSGALSAALVIAIGLEAHTNLLWARVPTQKRDGAANALLATLPPGPVLEYPVPGPDNGSAWAFGEAPRMVLSTIDWHPRVTGYSGFFPPAFPAQAQALSELPAADALQLADGFGVRYLVIRTAPIDTGVAAIDGQVSDAGVSNVSVDRARAMVDTLRALPGDRVADSVEVAGAVVVTLS